MILKLLLDENVSPSIARDLCAEGIDTTSVRDRKLLGASDPEVFAKAFAEDRIVVTANVRDFEHLARNCELHGGVILLEQNDLTPTEQLELLRRAVTAITARNDMVNTLLRVAEDGTFSFEDVPSEE